MFERVIEQDGNLDRERILTIFFFLSVLSVPLHAGGVLSNNFLVTAWIRSLFSDALSLATLAGLAVAAWAFVKLGADQGGGGGIGKAIMAGAVAFILVTVTSTGITALNISGSMM